MNIIKVMCQYWLLMVTNVPSWCGMLVIPLVIGETECAMYGNSIIFSIFCKFIAMQKKKNLFKEKITWLKNNTPSTPPTPPTLAPLLSQSQPDAESLKMNCAVRGSWNPVNMDYTADDVVKRSVFQSSQLPHSGCASPFPHPATLMIGLILT